MSLFELKKVVVGPETLCATVQLDAAAPVMTSDDIEGTQRVYDLMPQIADHACISEAGDVFRDALPNTECAHLLEHVCVELMSRLDLEDVSAGNPAAVPGEERMWTIKLSCPDDVLVAGVVSSAVWIMEWAFTGGHGAKPDLDSIVEGLHALVKSLPEDAAQN